MQLAASRNPHCVLPWSRLTSDRRLPACPLAIDSTARQCLSPGNSSLESAVVDGVNPQLCSPDIRYEAAVLISGSKGDALVTRVDRETFWGEEIPLAACLAHCALPGHGAKGGARSTRKRIGSAGQRLFLPAFFLACIRQKQGEMGLSQRHFLSCYRLMQAAAAARLDYVWETKAQSIASLSRCRHGDTRMRNPQRTCHEFQGHPDSSQLTTARGTHMMSPFNLALHDRIGREHLSLGTHHLS